jgi:hypothetical protein
MTNVIAGHRENGSERRSKIDPGQEFAPQQCPQARGYWFGGMLNKGKP